MVEPIQGHCWTSSMLWGKCVCCGKITGQGQIWEKLIAGLQHCMYFSNETKTGPLQWCWENLSAMWAAAEVFRTKKSWKPGLGPIYVQDYQAESHATASGLCFECQQSYIRLDQSRFLISCDHMVCHSRKSYAFWSEFDRSKYKEMWICSLLM